MIEKIQNKVRATSLSKMSHLQFPDKSDAYSTHHLASGTDLASHSHHEAWTSSQAIRTATSRSLPPKSLQVRQGNDIFMTHAELSISKVCTAPQLQKLDINSRGPSNAKSELAFPVVPCPEIFGNIAPFRESASVWTCCSCNDWTGSLAYTQCQNTLGSGNTCGHNKCGNCQVA